MLLHLHPVVSVSVYLQACVDTATKSASGPTNFPLRVSLEHLDIHTESYLYVKGCCTSSIRSFPLPTTLSVSPLSLCVASQVEPATDGIAQKESEFFPERIVHLLTKLDWAALRKTTSEV